MGVGESWREILGEIGEKMRWTDNVRERLERWTWIATEEERPTGQLEEKRTCQREHFCSAGMIITLLHLSDLPPLSTTTPQNLKAEMFK